MTLTEQYQKILIFIERGEKIANEEFHSGTTGFAMSYISGPMFETWMNEINIFNDRYLKNHPLYKDIHSTIFHHKTQISSHKYMMGHLLALKNDVEFFQESSDDIQSANFSNTQILLGEDKKEMKSTIFISHRTTDVAFADIIRDFLIGIGVNGEMIFCSSLPGNDVKEKISVEVKENLRNSCLNIVILSKAYYESAYCLNEAGILWYNDTKVLPIALDDIQPSDMIGFLNDDYKIRRLNSDEDIAYIADLLKEVEALQNVKNATVVTQTQKLKSRYIDTPQISSITKNAPKLELFGIKENDKLDKNAQYQSLKLQCSKKSNDILNKVKKLYKRIAEIQIDDIAPVVRGFISDTPVEIHEGEKALITTMAEKLEIILPDDFFFVGSLSKPFNSVALPFCKPNYNGSKEEIEKYDMIEELYRTIIELTDWIPVEEGFRGIDCVRLCIGNNGTEPDEDIDVSLRIPQNAYMDINDLPKFSIETMEYIVKKCDLSALLEIVGTADYTNYDSTIKSNNISTRLAFSSNPWDDTDYEEEFFENVKNAIYYDVFKEGNDYIIKINFEYLKHNTIAAFPTPIMLKKKIDLIPYEIKSKGSAKIIKGTIKVND